MDMAPRSAWLLALLAAFAASPAAQSRAELEITSFPPGRLVWSGATPGTTNWIEWTPCLTNGAPWRRFTNVLAHSSVMSAEVPLAYRIRETPPTNPVPTRFDAREQGWVTPVRSQIGNRPSGEPDPGNSVGICWAMSAMATLESSLLMQGFTTDPDTPESSFSPWHLGNAVGEPPLRYNEPCYAYSGDFFPPEFPLFQTEPRTVFGYLSPEGTNGWGGGHVFWMLDYFLCWTGPVVEASAPVPVEAMTAQETLVWTNRNPPTADFILRGVYKYQPEDYASLAEFRTAAKQAILDHGAIQSYMLVLPGDFPGVDGLTFYDPNSFCIYCPRANLEPNLNHAIAVIGWDDDYPASASPAPGAWLIKESLGTNVYDGGFHWIAYEDQTFLRDLNLFYAVVAAPGTGYRWPGLLTHPGAQTRFGMMATDFLATGSSMWGQDSQGYARFHAEDGGSLKAIGLVTVNRNEAVTIGIYSGVDAQLNPTGLLGGKQVTLDERGYHLVDLDTPVAIGAAGDFIVSLTFVYNDQAEPLVYCLDPNLPPADTFVLTYTATNPAPTWRALTDVAGDGSLFIQALFSDP
jgi:C1A family cysteine protease